MYKDLSPEHVRPIARGETFSFSCHPGVPCFTDCCRELELALTPYDVLRLRARLGVDAAEFLERYALMEIGDVDALPRVYLGMVDDGRGSCPFVTPEGCSVYEDRPAACRTYPLGRGAFRRPDGRVQDLYVLLSEPHCQGFAAGEEQDVDRWLAHEGLAIYNAMNDLTLPVYQHLSLSGGGALSEEQVDSFILAFYNLDGLRERLRADTLPLAAPLDEARRRRLLEDDAALLGFAADWLRWQLFAEER